MRLHKGFTLIEMLLVVSIIALLIAILMPSIRQSRGIARISTCANQLHQLHLSVYQYQQMHFMRKPWQFANGSADYPHESGAGNGRPGTPARALIERTKILPDAKLLFCPDIPADYRAIYHPAPAESFVKFHASYTWHYEKIRAADDATPSGNGILWSNVASKDLVMADTNASSWASYGYPYSHPHYNALMVDGEVKWITSDEGEWKMWLWGPEKKPY